MKILVIKPRLGPKHQNVNDLTLIFDYQGKMICSLQITLSDTQTPILYHSNNFGYEIERVCGSRDRYKRLEAYTRAAVEPTEKGSVIDSNWLVSSET